MPRRSLQEDAINVLLRVAALYAIAALAAPGSAAAQSEPAATDYPARAIHIVVPFPAGGPSDTVARLIAQHMMYDWRQPVVVENRSGANTIIGAQVVARASPDGYTLLMVIDSTLAMNQFLYRSLPYDPYADFAPITLTTKTMSLLAVPAATGPKDVRELMARARAAPGKLNYGGGTITAQLMGHLFHKAAGLDIVYVPFRGTAETVQGLLNGSADLIYAATPVVLPLIDGGRARALAKLDSRSFPAVRGIPTLAEASGLTDFEELSVWLGLVAPKGTPRPVIDKLNGAVRAILSDPGIKQSMEATGFYPVTSTPEEFSAFIRSEAERWGPVLKSLDIHYD
jgi:tripartite-type tricarboxylate transporter receptor subunit TctC